MLYEVITLCARSPASFTHGSVGTAVRRRQRFSLPGVNEQHIILDGPFEGQVGRVRNEAAGQEVVPGAKHESGLE